MKKAIVALGSWGLMLAVALAHPHNNSIGTADWISESNSLEVALKVSVDDLEDLFSSKKREIRLGRVNDKPAEEVLKSYILKHLGIVSSEGQALPVEWIGYEVEESDTWIYVQFAFPQGTMKGCKMSNSILVAQNDQQTNFINVKKGNERKTLKFSKRRTILKLPSF